MDYLPSFKHRMERHITTVGPPLLWDMSFLFVYVDDILVVSTSAVGPSHSSGGCSSSSFLGMVNFYSGLVPHAARLMRFSFEAL